MSKLLRRQLFQMLETLQKAVGVLDRLENDQNADYAQTLLCEMQAGMIEMGDRIESVYGTSAKSIVTLENLCELLYQISVQGEDKKDVFMQQIKVCMWDLQKHMEKEVDNKTEIVFMPYKFAMWDSLESIYFAAKEDQNCTVYCMPIPYYTKDPEGNLEEYHYEGSVFEQTIDIVDCKKWDLAKRMPDIVYIHNPYDECNYVTSIHPRFYTKKIREYVGQVIYVPYFVLDDDAAKKKEVLPFVTTPGVLYADKVILQSARICELYKACFRDLMMQNNIVIKEEDLEKKFLALGSPKLERAVKSKTVEIPDEWKKLIYDRQGKKKTIIFYNTSVGEIINQKGKLLKKMQWVFQQFEKHKDQFVLLWRPHPLMLDTLKSMQRELMDKYIKLRTWYIQNKIGIYDEGVDLDLAVKISDGYYGAHSSVAELFKAEGKRVLYQSEGIYLMEEKVVPEYYYMLENGDDIYFCSANYSIMGVIKNKGIYRISVEAYVRLDKEVGIASMVYAYEKIFFLTDDGLYSYTIENCKCKLEVRLGEEAKYIRLYRHGDIIYIIPFEAYTIAEYNIKTKTLSYMESFRNQYISIWGNRFTPSWLGEHFYEYEGVIYYFMGNKPTIVAIDTLADCVRLYPLEDKYSADGQAFCGHMDNLYRVCEDGTVTEWSISKKQERIIARLPKKDFEKNASYEIMRWWEDELLLLHMHGLNGFAICVSTGRVRKLEEHELFKKIRNRITSEDIVTVCGPEEQLIWGCGSGNIISLDLKTGEHKILLDATDFEWKEFIGYSPDKLADDNQESRSGLVCLNSMFFERSCNAPKTDNANYICGKHIHEYVTYVEEQK